MRISKAFLLHDGSKTTREFEQIMSMPTWTKSARPVLLELGLIQAEEGVRRRIVHSLTVNSEKVAELLEACLATLQLCNLVLFRFVFDVHIAISAECDSMIVYLDARSQYSALN